MLRDCSFVPPPRSLHSLREVEPEVDLASSFELRAGGMSKGAVSDSRKSYTESYARSPGYSH
jgi:hypothetical protein